MNRETVVNFDFDLAMLGPLDLAVSCVPSEQLQMILDQHN